MPLRFSIKMRYMKEWLIQGINPTFTNDKEEPSVEVNIFDYNNDLYGEELYVEWHQYVRDEIKFNGVQELVNEIECDEKRIRNYFYN